jgi:hypothetical protein
MSPFCKVVTDFRTQIADTILKSYRLLRMCERHAESFSWIQRKNILTDAKICQEWARGTDVEWRLCAIRFRFCRMDCDSD